MTKLQNTPDVVKLAELNARKAELDKMISEATSWGAYLSELGEELRSVERAIRRIEGKTQ